jgi:MYXO-CTERM domain-containing protein
MTRRPLATALAAVLITAAIAHQCYADGQAPVRLDPLPPPMLVTPPIDPCGPVQRHTSTPEPGSALLLAVGLAALWVGRR